MSDLPPAPAPLKVRLIHGEVMAAAIASRSRGSGIGVWIPVLQLLLLMLAIWLGHLLAFYFVQMVPFSVMFAFGPYLPILLPALLCMVAISVAQTVAQWRAERVYLAHLAAIDAPLERDGTYTVTNQSLVLETERITIAPRWEAIDTVEKGERGWVLSADQLHLLIPFAAFPDADAQRPLLAAITARMTPEARARSREAVEFGEIPPEAHGGTRAKVSPWATAPSAISVTSADNASPPAELPVAKGWLTQEQASWAAGVIHGRISHFGFHRWAYPFTAGLTGVVLGTALMLGVGMGIPADAAARYSVVLVWIGYLVPILLGALGLAYGGKRAGIVVNKAWQAGLAARGVPDQVEATWRLNDNGLSYETARFTGVAPYASIHQVLHEAPYWIIGCDTLTLCIPDTAFASADEAKVFIAALLERIDDPARERSVKLGAA